MEGLDAWLCRTASCCQGSDLREDHPLLRRIIPCVLLCHLRGWISSRVCRGEHPYSTERGWSSETQPSQQCQWSAAGQCTQGAARALPAAGVSGWGAGSSLQSPYLHRGAALEAERLGLPVLQVHLEHVGHEQERAALQSKSSSCTLGTQPVGTSCSACLCRPWKTLPALATLLPCT